MKTMVPNLGIFIPIMGKRQKPSSNRKTPVRSRTSMVDALFSNTQQRVLGLLFGQPQRSFYASEIIGLAGIGSGAVQRELERLSRSGLVTVRAVGNQKHYQANPDSPLFAELCGIAQKTTGLAEPLREALRPLESHIRAAFVYGSIAKRQDSGSSDIDLMVISDELSYGDVFSFLELASTRLGRTVNPTILSTKELGKRLKDDNGFVSRVLAQPKIWLIGDGLPAVQ